MTLAPIAISNGLPGHGKHVLYVDDDQALVFLVERVLRRKGFTVTTFNDPQEAQAALAERAQDFDLLVTDYNMPGYSGLDLLRAVKAIRPDLPVALASGYVTAELEKDMDLISERDLTKEQVVTISRDLLRGYTKIGGHLA